MKHYILLSNGHVFLGNFSSKKEVGDAVIENRKLYVRRSIDTFLTANNMDFAGHHYVVYEYDEKNIQTCTYKFVFYSESYTNHLGKTDGSRKYEALSVWKLDENLPGKIITNVDYAKQFIADGKYRIDYEPKSIEFVL